MGLLNRLSGKRDSETLIIHSIISNVEMEDWVCKPLLEDTYFACLKMVKPDFANKQSMEDSISTYAGGVMIAFAKAEKLKYDIKDLSYRRFYSPELKAAGWIFTWPMRRRK